MNQFKPIKDFEKRYEITNRGRVKSLKRTTKDVTMDRVRTYDERILTPKTDKKGYKRISLRREMRTYDRLIHRLVAIVYIPNPNNLPYINHLDGNPSNNYYKNLEWCTHKDNIQHASANGMMKHWCTSVEQYDLENNLLDTFKSIRIAAKVTGIDRTAIRYNGMKDTPMKKYPYNFKLKENELK